MRRAVLDAEIAAARETLLCKRTRAALRGLNAHDRAEIQSRIEKIVREINAAGGNQIGIQGDLSGGDEVIEVWDLVTFTKPLLGISIESGKIKIR